MQIALTAKIRVNLERLLQDKWGHDMAHLIADAKRRALLRQKQARLRQRKSPRH